MVFKGYEFDSNKILPGVPFPNLNQSKTTCKITVKSSSKRNINLN